MTRLCLLAAGWALAFAASAGLVKTYPVGNIGSLRMEMGDGWRESGPGSVPAGAISMEASRSGQMQFLVTPLPARTTLEDIRQLVGRTAERIGPQSVEKKLPLQSLKGAQATGYYFKATDPAPRPGEYRYMYQGGVTAEGATVMFTVLFNDGAERDAGAALDAIRNLEFREATAPMPAR